ncbi:hypothetical protein [Williamsia muralis]|uniref:hypothetical protein n=1 Tax=Williamsia marianensis TaxID=85044 RepID=UPI000DE74634|nr:hypothetical protein [Williamsia marianensis]PVY32997.1 hypothetical protein C7458_102755 [Williamsia marianensis]
MTIDNITRPTPTDEAMSLPGRHRRAETETSTLARKLDTERNADVVAELRETYGRLSTTLEDATGMTHLLLASIVAQLAELIDVMDPEHPLDLWPVHTETSGEVN